MNNELLEEAIDHWAQHGLTVVRTIESNDNTVKRILRRGGLYWLYRYSEISPEVASLQVVCSVDLDCVHADRVIQHLAERL